MGIEVRYLAYPRAGINSEAYNKIATAWCSDTPQQALTDLKNGSRLPTNVCAGNPVAEHYRLGAKVGVNGTPAIVLMDGTMIPGYRPAADFAEIFGLTAKIN
jgi:thiol:disulfide interchange protein DsbC